ncbi:putative carbonic anhydrase [Lyophyllum shimeji]|uniref:Carbonic anhydrase n=1 Tax=Lyophyllum shimeji TaxID=47721 RepID=A0A9P3PPZ0_LYOSH|nr:putative carbonic anhydrase [Lyophyllum shimeji]
MYFFTALLFESLAASQAAQVPLQPQSHFASDPLSAGGFTYTGVTGPLGWAGLSPDNKLCATGSYQSPVNLDASIWVPKTNPWVSIPDGYGSFENTGHTVEVAAVGTTVFDGRTYQLKQLHFHAPSEHRINEEFYPLEVHFVHEAADGVKLVLGATFEISTNGATTDLVQVLGSHVYQIAAPGSKVYVPYIRVQQVVNFFRTTRLYQYWGSLTTPPCSEGVVWLVAQNPLPIDVSSYLAFKKVINVEPVWREVTPLPAGDVSF